MITIITILTNKQGEIMSVDLTKKPYYLKDEDIQWVKNTIANMTLEEKSVSFL